MDWKFIRLINIYILVIIIIIIIIINEYFNRIKTSVMQKLITKTAINVWPVKSQE
jgi:hypothetical protein